MNQTGVFLGMQAVANQMIAQHSGAIVNISSVGGLRGASGGLRLRREQMGGAWHDQRRPDELGPYGIRVNSIHPG